jgi:hypothetical protein
MINQSSQQYNNSNINVLNNFSSADNTLPQIRNDDSWNLNSVFNMPPQSSAQQSNINGSAVNMNISYNQNMLQHSGINASSLPLAIQQGVNGSSNPTHLNNSVGGHSMNGLSSSHQHS